MMTVNEVSKLTGVSIRTLQYYDKLVCLNRLSTQSQENCNMKTPSDNLIIYGHHMNNGSMFSELTKFEDKSFLENHKTITFNILTEKQEYEVVAVFKIVAYSQEGFRYYDFVNADTTEDFVNYNILAAKKQKMTFYNLF